MIISTTATTHARWPDAATLSLFVFTVVFSVTTQISADFGVTRLTLNSPEHFLWASLGVLLLRAVMARYGKGAPFRFPKGWRPVFLRLLEIALVAHLVLIVVSWSRGPVSHGFFETPSLEESVGSIFALGVTRLLLGRHHRALMAVGSSLMTLVLILYGLEFVLGSHEARLLEEAGVQGGEGNMKGNGDEEFDPTRNDGVNWTWGHRVVNNSYGFREKEFAVPKPDGVFRLMILGDSLTWGSGLPTGERYSALLEEELAAALPDRSVEVLNFGFPGGPTVKERDLLLDVGDQVEADLVVMGFCFNDPQALAQNYSRERTRLEGIYTLVARLRFLGLERTYAWLISRIDHVAARMEAIPTWEEAMDRVYESESSQWKEFEEALEEVAAYSEERGLPPPVFILLIQGIASDQPEHPYYTRWFRQVGTTARRHGLVVVDPTDRFIAELVLADIPVNPMDGHPSAVCNKIYAEELTRAVLSLISDSAGE